MDKDVNLLRAAKSIRDLGWMKGDYGAINGPKCIIGAIMLNVSFETTQDTKNYVTSRVRLAEMLDSEPTKYNDTCINSKEEAEAILVLAGLSDADLNKMVK